MVRPPLRNPDLDRVVLEAEERQSKGTRRSFSGDGGAVKERRRPSRVDVARSQSAWGQVVQRGSSAPLLGAPATPEDSSLSETVLSMRLDRRG